MEPLQRRGFLKMLAAVGTAAACGMKAGESLAATGSADAVSPAAPAAQAATETTENSLETNQFYIVRRRRWRPRRRVYYVRRRRPVYFVRRRPRRYFVVRRARRWRRW